MYAPPPFRVGPSRSDPLFPLPPLHRAHLLPGQSRPVRHPLPAHLNNFGTFHVDDEREDQVRGQFPGGLRGRPATKLSKNEEPNRGLSELWTASGQQLEYGAFLVTAGTERTTISRLLFAPVFNDRGRTITATILIAVSIVLRMPMLFATTVYF